MMVLLQCQAKKSGAKRSIHNDESPSTLGRTEESGRKHIADRRLIDMMAGPLKAFALRGVLFFNVARERQCPEDIVLYVTAIGSKTT